MSSTAQPAWIASLTDATLQAEAQAAYNAGGFTYASMIAMLQQVAHSGPVSQAQFSSLQTIAANLNVGMSTPSNLCSLFSQLVNGSKANDYWTGGGASSSVLGNLAVGTSSTQMNELIGKWFLGTDLPANVDGASSWTYQNESQLALFGPNGPSQNDTYQGAIGDCVLLSTINALCAASPQTIQNMIVNDGGGVYSVKFIINGNEEWVTVNSAVATYSGSPNSFRFGSASENGTDYLWIPILEKAFIALGTTGLDTSLATDNNFSTIDGLPGSTFTDVTGAQAQVCLQDSMSDLTSYKQILINAVEEKQPVILSSGVWTTDPNNSSQTQFVASHEFALVGYDATTGNFIVRNPWGGDNSTSGYEPQFEASLATIATLHGNIRISNLATQSSSINVQATNLVVGYGNTVAVSSLFVANDVQGKPITKYMFFNADANAGTILLNGATNLATAAQTALGEIVVSASDLSKVQYIAPASSAYNANIVMEAYDGAWSPETFISPGWSVAQSLTFNSNGLNEGQTVTLSALVSPPAISGKTYYVEIGTPSSGSLNLNGVKPWATWSDGVVVAASQLSQITYTAPAQAGQISLKYKLVTNGVYETNWEYQDYNIASVATATAAVQYGAAGQYGEVAGIVDSATNIFANLDSLQRLVARDATVSIRANDAKAQKETITAAQFVADKGALAILGGVANVCVSGANVALAENPNFGGSTALSFSVSDSSAAIFNNLDQLQDLMNKGLIIGVHANDYATDTISYVQFRRDAGVIAALNKSVNIQVAGGSNKLHPQLISPPPQHFSVTPNIQDGLALLAQPQFSATSQQTLDPLSVYAGAIQLTHVA